MDHLNFVGYSNFTEIVVPQEIEGNTRSPKTVISTNMKNLKHSKSKTKLRPERESPFQDASQLDRPTYSCSPSRRVSQRKFTTTREHNEGCSGVGDGQYPP